MGAKEVRDAVHGLIELTEREWAVVDTLAFQRLRNVQQLAMTHLVYPGARHSRFEHCLGACHIAGRMANAVNRHRPDAQVSEERVRLAALVHDVGHGPFSHVSEMVFEQRTGRAHIHERISAAIVRHDPAVAAAIGEEDADWIADLLSGQGHGARRSVERDIVAGPADIDKLDYLLRDSHYCGVNYGRYDLDKLIETARVLDDVMGSKLAYHVDGVYALEEMLLARYHMTRQVYAHKTRIATDLMLVRAMGLGVTEGVLPEEVFDPPEQPDAEFVEAYLAWDDARVIRTLTSRDDSLAGQVMRALVTRRLLKRVDRLRLPDLQDEFGVEIAGYVIDPDEQTLRELLARMEEAIAERLGVEAHWVALHFDRRESPVLRPYSPRVTNKDIVLIDDEGRTQKFDDVSEIYSRGEGEPQHSISLYVRPPGDESERLEPRTVRTAFIDALGQLGTAAQRA